MHRGRTAAPSVSRACKMAAPRGGSGPGSDSGSDSDSGGEAAARFREAAWDCTAQAEPRGGGFRKDRLLPKDQPSLRQWAARRVTMSSRPRQSSEHTLQRNWEPCWTGFRLFSSSVPGDCGKPEPCPARRRRPVSSSDTDSDQEWQRFQEAAVSAADILKQSAFPALSQGSSQEQSQANVEPKQKKKKKKKIRKENNIQEQIIDPAECAQICKDLPRLVSANGQQERQNSNHRENAVLPGAVKKKKKKKKE
ncbi:protein CUSTOS isoform X2 [Chamaea fasciata]|uniref:protein CUSTOS isoform X2 n=1 Tax=Chamaea fasciata TaxID=190680 RepID=UPI003369EBD8